MNISIDDAIDLHRCIGIIEMAFDDFNKSQVCAFGLLIVNFTKMNNIEILSVYFNGHESLKAKEKLQEYFDE